jgi:hypothetical protein
MRVNIFSDGVARVRTLDAPHKAYVELQEADGSSDSITILLRDLDAVRDLGLSIYDAARAEILKQAAEI